MIEKQPAILFTLSEILTDRFFAIPDYQRGYSWIVNQLNDLTKDIQNLLSKNYIHFTGTIVASPNRDNTNYYDIVDGQQRLTSLTILLVELCRLNHSDDRFKSIWSTYIERGGIGKEEMVLKSNEETRSYFYNCIIKNEDIQPEIKSHECIKFAKSYFRNWLLDNPDLHVDVLDAILNKMGFIFFTPQNDKEIGIMFEVINNRGKGLSELEKIKNYFIYYSTVHDFPSLRKKINDIWKELQRFLNQANITSNEAENDFLRYCIIIVFDARKSASNYAYDNLKERFNINENDQQIKEDNVQQMESFISFIKYSAMHMAYLNNRNYFEANYNGPFKNELSSVLAYIRCMPSKASILPLYLSLMMRWNEEEKKVQVVELLNLLEVLNFRIYVLPGISARADSGQGSTFNFAKNFYHFSKPEHSKDQWITSSWQTPIEGDVFEWLRVELREFIFERCNDHQMIDALTLDEFEGMDFYRWGQGLRYLLANYEESKKRELKQGIQVDQILRTRDELGKDNQNDYLSIEHIWASNNRAEDFPHNDLQKRRLGNFVLLGLGFNNSFKDIDIPEKIKAMQNSKSINRGALTLIQVAELLDFVLECERFVEDHRNHDKTTKNYFSELATRICDIRETELIKFSIKRWPIPAIPNKFSFEKVDSFATAGKDKHYILHEEINNYEFE